MATSKKKFAIEKQKLLLVEGADAYWFSIWACRAFNLPEIQVVDFGGITQLEPFMEVLPLRPDFEQVLSLAVVRDVETDAKQAIRSVRSSFCKAGLTEPEEPYSWTDGAVRTAFGLLPGSTQEEADGATTYSPGALEHLCLATVNDEILLKIVDDFLKTVVGHAPLSHPHKSRLHAYLSVKNDYVGMKIGEAAQANAWDWNHPSLEKFKQLMQTL